MAIQYREIVGTYTVGSYGNVWARLSETIHSLADGESLAPEWIIATVDPATGTFSASHPVTDDPDVYTGSGRVPYMRIIEYVGGIAPRNYKVEIQAGGTPLNLALIPHLNDGSEDYAIRGGAPSRLTDYLVDKGIQYWPPKTTGITPDVYYNHVRYDDLGRALDGTLEDYITPADLDEGILVARADLANADDPAKGDALVGFKQLDIGAVASTVHKKLGTILSISDFNAHADGVTSDSDALEAVIAAAGARGGAIVLLEPGKDYYIPRTVNVSAPVIIDGQGATLLTTENGRFFNGKASHVQFHNVKFGLAVPYVTHTVSDTDQASTTIEVVNGSGFAQGTGIRMRAVLWDNGDFPHLLGISAVNGNILTVAQNVAYSAPAGVAVTWTHNLQLYTAYSTTPITEATTVLTFDTSSDLSWLTLLTAGQLLNVVDDKGVVHNLAVGSVASPIVNVTQSVTYSAFTGRRITNGLFSEALIGSSLNVAVGATGSITVDDLGIFAKAYPAGTVNAQIYDDVGYWRGVSITGVATDVGTGINTINFLNMSGVAFRSTPGINPYPIIKATAGAQLLDRISDPSLAGNYEDWYFENCEFRCVSASFTMVQRGPVYDGRYIASGTDVVKNIVFHKCNVFDNANNQYALEFGKCEKVILSHTRVHHNGDGASGSVFSEGVKVTASTDNTIIDNSFLEYNSRNGLDCFDSGRVTMNDTLVKDNAGGGMELKGGYAQVSGYETGWSIFTNNKFIRNGVAGAAILTPRCIFANNLCAHNGRSPYAKDTPLFPPLANNTSPSSFTMGPVTNGPFVNGQAYIGSPWKPITITNVAGQVVTYTQTNPTYVIVDATIGQTPSAGSVASTILATVTQATKTMLVADVNAGWHTDDTIYVLDSGGIWRSFTVTDASTNIANTILVNYTGSGTFTAPSGNALNLLFNRYGTIINNITGATIGANVLRVLDASGFIDRLGNLINTVGYLLDDTFRWRQFIVSGGTASGSNQFLSISSWPGAPTFVASGTNLITTDPTTLSNSAYGLRFDGAGSSTTTFEMIIANNYFYGNASGGMFARFAKRAKIIGNGVHANGIPNGTGLASVANGIYLLNTVEDCLLIGNTAFGNALHGIVVGGSRNKVNGNATQDPNGNAVLQDVVTAVSINGYGEETGSGAPTGTWPTGAIVRRTTDGSVWLRTLTSWAQIA
jgi:parallel beta-helix repeat protein